MFKNLSRNSTFRLLACSLVGFFYFAFYYTRNIALENAMFSWKEIILNQIARSGAYRDELRLAISEILKNKSQTRQLVKNARKGRDFYDTSHISLNSLQYYLGVFSRHIFHRDWYFIKSVRIKSHSVPIQMLFQQFRDRINY